MTARSDLRAALAKRLPETWVIHEQAQTPDRVTAPTVVIARREVTPLPEAPKARWRHVIDVWLLTPQLATGLAEDALDALLDTLTAAIDDIGPTVWWTRATRAVLDEIAHAWRLDCVTHTQITPTPTPTPEPEPEPVPDVEPADPEEP